MWREKKYFNLCDRNDPFNKINKIIIIISETKTSVLALLSQGTNDIWFLKDLPSASKGPNLYDN